MTISSTVLNRRKMVQSAFIGAFIGMNAALPMYLWQSNTEVAVACFIIVGYTSWLVAATWSEITQNYAMRTDLDRLPINRTHRRLGRMFTDPGFWWSLMFGGATVTGSVWYAGFRQTAVLVTAGVIWGLIAFLLNFGLTLLQPTTRCRRCGYQLAPHMNPTQQSQALVCPECGSAWTKDDLLLSEGLETVRERRRRRRRAA